MVAKYSFKIIYNKRRGIKLLLLGNIAFGHLLFFWLFLFISCLPINAIYAQNTDIKYNKEINEGRQSDPNIFSIVTCPGENVSNQMNISWAAADNGTCLLYTTKKDKKWRHARKIIPVQRICATFDSVYSKTPDNKNFYEQEHFVKCDATLVNLKKDTEYKYYICSNKERIHANNSEDIASKGKDDIHYFKTAGAKEWSACIISDFHSYTPIPNRLKAAMGMIDKIKEYDPKFDWILHLGDICAWGGSYSFWRRLYQEEYFHKYMWAGVNGNHDNMTRKYRLTNEFFRDANFYPRNGYKGEEGVCYFFTYGNALFVMLNNENMRSDEQLAAAQNWVRTVVEQNRAKFVIVCEHYQWFFGNDGNTSQYARWCKLFDELDVDLALSANNHIYVRTKPIGHSYKGKDKGTVYIQAPSSDNERGVEITDSLKFNTDVIKFRWSEGAHTVGAMHIKVTDKEMAITLIDRNGKIIDKTVIDSKL